MTGPAPGDDLGALLRLVRDWAQRNLPAPESGHGGPECRWCPLCQLASALRGENPELPAGLSESVAALAQAARAMLESAAGRPAATDAGRHPRPAPPPSRVQRIHLDGFDEETPS